MRLSVFTLAGAALLAVSTIAAADDNGALTGAAGGAVTGAVVGGPVGAAVGGVAGAVLGGAATGAPRPVVVEPAQPCATRTTTATITIRVAVEQLKLLIVLISAARQPIGRPHGAANYACGLTNCSAAVVARHFIVAA